MKDLKSGKNQVECIACSYEFQMIFTFKNDKVEKVEPEVCPKCGNTTFRSKFHVDPNAWFGVFGTKG